MRPSNATGWLGVVASPISNEKAKTVTPALSQAKGHPANLCGSIVGKKCDKIGRGIDPPKNELRDAKGEKEI